MRVYIGQTRSHALVARLRSLGYGEMTVRGELPSYRSPYAFDNGVYRDWSADVPWEGGVPMKKGVPIRKSPIHPEADWKRDIEWLEAALTDGGGVDGVLYPPDFIVAPDMVGGGLASLKMSAEYAYQLRALEWNKVALAVQDGMTVADVTPYLSLFSHLFVGGTSEWKGKTAHRWVEFAHKNELRCHIGRVGTVAKVEWAKRIGADSIDSCLPLWSTEKLDAFIDAVNGVSTTTQRTLW